MDDLTLTPTFVRGSEYISSKGASLRPGVLNTGIADTFMRAAGKQCTLPAALNGCLLLVSVLN